MEPVPAVTEEREGAAVQAAGGLIFRRNGGVTEVALVHRPARSDWSFPKGKLEAGESLEECARREVFEETGLRCRLGRFVGRTRYRDQKDRAKVVAYWMMEVEGGEFAANPEVDELSWLDLATASAVLTYDRDRQLFGELVAAMPEPGVSA